MNDFSRRLDSATRRLYRQYQLQDALKISAISQVAPPATSLPRQNKPAIREEKPKSIQGKGTTKLNIKACRKFTALRRWCWCLLYSVLRHWGLKQCSVANAGSVSDAKVAGTVMALAFSPWLSGALRGVVFRLAAAFRSIELTARNLSLGGKLRKH